MSSFLSDSKKKFFKRQFKLVLSYLFELKISKLNGSKYLKSKDANLYVQQLGLSSKEPNFILFSLQVRCDVFTMFPAMLCVCVCVYGKS